MPCSDESRNNPILVSACLAGVCCRYDGGATPHPVIMRLAHEGLALPVCPEVLGGLPVPREPVELRGGRALTRAGTDCTGALHAGAHKALALGRDRGCLRAVLKSRSPSCGAGRVYDGTFSGRLVSGDGFFAALLKAQGFAVQSEEEL
ncbi:MAG: DUF523 domain-containing protein [Proteobacteria bacterium]|nr:DUF523 domain-containing protein [Pseudomonadota bacterium]MBU1596451.1 DUF523 domain-containing protein [Pseudomonadota bacterium]